MPGIYSPSPSHAHTTSSTSYFDAAPHFSYATETSGRQVIDSDAHETRKRSRGNSATRRPATTAWGSNSLACNRFTDAKSPPPLANDRYQLADGGMDQSHTYGRQVGDYDDYFQLQKQRGQWSVPPTPATGMRQMATYRTEMTPSETKPWSILGLVGGVAGKFFQFCTVPFRGFQAGSGQRYTIDSHGEAAARLGLRDDLYVKEKAGPVQQTPGGFPQDDYGVKSIDSLDNDRSERPRMTKRLRTADNWVLVGDDGEVESRPSTPRLSERRVPDHPRSPSQIPRPLSRASVVTPGVKRPSLIPVSRRSAMDRRSIHGSAKAVPSSHTRQRSYSRLSYGSPAMHEEKAKKPASPLPKDSQRLINKVRREEMEEDARLRRMSSQMSAMLREAKEALGSKFEIEDEYEDNGSYGDGELLQQSGYFPRFS
ncbi:hypothetical protein CC86DRAFT_296584 [Ophiobolus disseminans]|uniref:Uncharacterized protein n=1 Tax=Ophiobolus disseminans TaxID=1469910 RepID=A0A6A6ZTW6_9PLEO|nr:hypothetical protein CC86DRAFT_296584 [Ophiobolus disseminans]